MPRQPRSAPGGLIYHVMNRSNARARLFETDADYQSFERALEEAAARVPGVRVLGYCVMPDHWHAVLWPRREGELSSFMRWLTLTHVQRHHAAHRTAGTGHLYQGRFKSFPVEPRAEALSAVLRFVESNALRDRLVRRAEDWRWSSLWRRVRGEPGEAALLAPWPVERPRGWAAVVNRPQPPAEFEAVRRSVVRSRPYGSDPWVLRTADRLDLQWTLRPRGRPPKPKPPVAGGKAGAKRGAKAGGKQVAAPEPPPRRRQAAGRRTGR